MGTHPIFESDFDCLTEMEPQVPGLEMQAQAQMIQLAQVQAMQDQYMKLQSACEQKCISTNYRQQSLTKVEAVCLDNCATKYLEFNHQIQVHMREMQEPAMLEMLRMQQMELGRQMGL